MRWVPHHFKVCECSWVGVDGRKEHWCHNVATHVLYVDNAMSYGHRACDEHANEWFMKLIEQEINLTGDEP